MMNLDSYTPKGNEIVLELNQTIETASGILLAKPKQDRVMKILLAGELAGEDYQPGTWVLMGPGGAVDIPFRTKDGKVIIGVQTSVHSILGIYAKDEATEDKVYVDGGDSDEVRTSADDDNSPPPSNIIENAGMGLGDFGPN
jgi:hypothetical protein